MDEIRLFKDTVVQIEAIGIPVAWDIPFSKTDIMRGTGSGFIVNEQGYIVTCFHIVDQSVELFVSLPYYSKKKYPARIIAIYPEKDIAVIQAELPRPTKWIPIGDSDRIAIGQMVFTAGYPLSGDFKVTKGIVSGFQDGYIQTDATINPGNSGGPLILDGRVVGINTAKIAMIGVEGTGYANPIVYFLYVHRRMGIELPASSLSIISTMNQDAALKRLTETVSIPDLRDPEREETQITRINRPSLGILTDICSPEIIHYYLCSCGGPEEDPKGEKTGIQMTRVFDASPLKVGETPAKDGDILCTIDGIAIDNNGECSIPMGDTRNQEGVQMKRQISWLELVQRVALQKDKIDVEYFSIHEDEVQKRKAAESRSQSGGSRSGVQVGAGIFSLGSFLDMIQPSEYIEPREIKERGTLVRKSIPVRSTKEIFRIWNYYPPYDRIDYCCFGGIVFMNLTMNHMKTIQRQHLFYKYINDLDKSAVILSKLFPSTVLKEDILHEGDIIHRINDIPIKTVRDVQDALKRPVYRKDERTGRMTCYITFHTDLNHFYAIELVKIVREDLRLLPTLNYEPSDAIQYYLKNRDRFECLGDLKLNLVPKGVK